MLPVTVDFTLSPQDYARALRAFYASDPRYRPMLGCSGFLFLIILVMVPFAVIGGSLDKRAMPAILFGFLFPGIIVITYFLMPWLTARQVRKDERLRAASSYRFDDEGVSCATKFAQTHFDWGTLHSVTETHDDYLLVLSANRHMFHLVPKRVFGTSELEDEFRALLRRHVGHYEDRRQASRGWLKTLLIPAGIFGLLVIAALSTGSLTNRGRWEPVGEIDMRSASLLVTDPYYLPEIDQTLMVQMEGIAPGTYPVEVFFQDRPKWGERPWQARILFKEGARGARQKVGEAAVDSATLSFVDPGYLSEEWVVEGPRRDGCIWGADRDKIGKLLVGEGYSLGAEDWCLEISEPVSVEAEQRIMDMIEANSLRGTISISTGDTLDLLMEAMDASALTDHSTGTLSFKDGRTGFMVAFESGMGDGVYPVYGLYEGSQLVGVEVDMR